MWTHPVFGKHTTRRPLVLGHRGARLAAGDNTIESFTLARAQGADGVELDVRPTADGALIVHHDPAVAELDPFVELDLPTIRNECPTVPTLDEALDCLAGLLVNIEIKNSPLEPGYDPSNGLARTVAGVVRSRGLMSDVIVSSFDPGTLAAVRDADGAIATGQLIPSTFDPVAACAAVAAAGHLALHPPLSLLDGQSLEATCAAADAKGLVLAVWTVNDPTDVRRLGNAGVDVIITDDPAGALAALRA